MFFAELYYNNAVFIYFNHEDFMAVNMNAQGAAAAADLPPPLAPIKGILKKYTVEAQLSSPMKATSKKTQDFAWEVYLVPKDYPRTRPKWAEGRIVSDEAQVFHAQATDARGRPRALYPSVEVAKVCALQKATQKRNGQPVVGEVQAQQSAAALHLELEEGK